MPSNEFEKISVSLVLTQTLTTNYLLAKDRPLLHLYGSSLTLERCATIGDRLEANQRKQERTQAPPPPKPNEPLDLSNLKLEAIPEAYTSGEALVEATAIGLSGNKFKYIPDILLRLDIATSLRGFSFGRNLLSGRLSSLIARMHHLTYLDLSRNALTALPPEISALQSLESLDLRWNTLTDYGMPIQLFRMKHLVHLKLQKNPITTVPEELFKMSKLTNVLLTGTAVPLVKQRIVEAWSNRETTLDLSGQELIVVPRELGFLKSLEALYLQRNKLTSVPPEIGELTRLRTLDLSGNNLENLPWTIANLAKLENLFIKGNPLSSLPAEVVNRDAAFVKTFLGSLKDGKVSCNRMKVGGRDSFLSLPYPSNISSCLNLTLSKS
jgi:Leucine-rich repeat (LRR) protein